MTQTRTQSLIESCTNIGIGFVINFFAQLVIFPSFGMDVTIGENIGIGLSFTVVSVARMYLIRRYFNGRR
jgi:hypothetical protein